MEKLLEVEHLTKVFTLGSMLSRIRITAVDNVSFYIKPAEIFALAGESGCGKTTTARMILGFEEPTSGTIVHNGKVVRDPRTRRSGSPRAYRRSSRTPSRPSTPCARSTAISLRRSRTTSWPGTKTRPSTDRREAEGGRPVLRRVRRQVPERVLRRATAADLHRQGAADRPDAPDRG